MISYQCRPGLIPEGRVMSVCGGDGRWNPDPDQQYALRPRNYLITSCLEDCIEHMGSVNQCLRVVLFTFIAHNLQFSSVSKREHLLLERQDFIIILF